MNQPKKICAWCGEEIVPGQLYEKDSDGDCLHLACACEADDEDPGMNK